MASLARTLLLICSNGNSKSSSDDGIVHHPRAYDTSDPRLQDLAVVGSLEDGFIAMGVLACFSFVATLTLLSFLTYRMVFWRSYFRTPLIRNQCILLIYNLLLVDLQQSVSFMLCLHWVATGRASFDSAACILQGWWLQIADPGSGLFVLAIAIHTLPAVIRGRQLPFKIFVACIVALWVFIIILGIIPVALYRRRAFIVSEAGWVGRLTSFPYVAIYLQEEVANKTFPRGVYLVLDGSRIRRYTSMVPLLLDFHRRIRHHRPIRHHVLLPQT